MQGPAQVGCRSELNAAKQTLSRGGRLREWEDERMLVLAEAEEAVMVVEGGRAIILGVDQEREGRDLGSGGALGCLSEKSATKAAAAKALIDCEPPETGGGYARIAGQPAGCRLRHVAQEHGAHRQRVIAGDLTCRPHRLNGRSSSA